MTRTGRLWTAVTLAIVVFVGLEAAYWFRPFAHGLRSGGSPYIELANDGTPVLVAADWKLVAGELVGERREFDENGTPLRTQVQVHDARRVAETPTVAPFFGAMRHHPFVRMEHGLPRPGQRADWADEMVNQLDASQSGLSGFSREARIEKRPSMKGWWSPLAWTFEDGRFVCRNILDDRVVAGFGPDGWREGGEGRDGERFDRARVQSALAMDAIVMSGPKPPQVLVDPERRAVHFVAFDLYVPDAKGMLQNRVDRTKEPIRLSVKSVSVSGPNGQPPSPLPALARERGFQRYFSDDFVPADGVRRERAIPVMAGSELVGVTERGVVRGDVTELKESEIQPAGTDRVLWSALPPVGGSTPRVRNRWWREDGTLTRRDVSVPAVTWKGRAGLALTGLATLVRPPLANAVSFAGPRVKDWNDSFTRWFLDPLVAGGDGAGWFAGSLAVAALCGWLTHRAARTRLGSSREVWMWTAAGALLGVPALVAMRFVVPRSHVTACACGRWRAVHLATCPACSSRWPAPASTGIEVFA